MVCLPDCYYSSSLPPVPSASSGIQLHILYKANQISYKYYRRQLACNQSLQSHHISIHLYRPWLLQQFPYTLVILQVLVYIAEEGFRKGVKSKGLQIFVIGVGEVYRSKVGEVYRSRVEEVYRSRVGEVCRSRKGLQ